MLTALIIGVLGAFVLIPLAFMHDAVRGYWSYRKACATLEEASRTHAKLREQLIPYWYEDEPAPPGLYDEYRKAGIRHMDALIKAKATGWRSGDELEAMYHIDHTRPETRTMKELRESRERIAREVEAIEI